MKNNQQLWVESPYPTTTFYVMQVILFMIQAYSKFIHDKSNVILNKLMG